MRLLRIGKLPYCTTFIAINHTSENTCDAAYRSLSATTTTAPAAANTLCQPTTTPPPAPRSTSPPTCFPPPHPLTLPTLLSFPPFKTWHDTLTTNLRAQNTNPFPPSHTDAYTLRRIDIQAVDFFGQGEKQRVGFVKLVAEVSNDVGERLAGGVFLRGGSVGMMIVLQPDDTPPGSEEGKHVILTIQQRIPAGSLAFVELPAGMIDESGTFAGAAAKEIREECGLEIPAEELVDMTALALEGQQKAEGEQVEGEREGQEGGEVLQTGFYPSPGGCDEFIPLFYHYERVPRGRMEEMRGKLTGLRGEGERISLRLVELGEFWRVGGRDGKCLAAWALYCGLKGEGKL